MCSRSAPPRSRRAQPDRFAPPRRRLQHLAKLLKGREPRLEDYESHHRADVALHRLVAEATGNALLQQILDTLNGRIARVRMVNSPSRFHRSLHRHLAIVAVLRRGDPEAAAEAMRMHLANARESLSTLS